MTKQSPLKDFWSEVIEGYDFSPVSVALKAISPNRKHNHLSLANFKDNLLDAAAYIGAWQNYINENNDHPKAREPEGADDENVIMSPRMGNTLIPPSKYG